MPLGRRVFGSSGRKIKHTHTHSNYTTEHGKIP